VEDETAHNLLRWMTKRPLVVVIDVVDNRMSVTPMEFVGRGVVAGRNGQRGG
jgi:hypothetical protein